MTKKLHIKTWGCQMNEYDSSKMADLLDATHGYQLTDNANEADVLLLNTCSIREKAQEKVFHQLGRWKLITRKRPDVIIGVGGCVASQEGKLLRFAQQPVWRDPQSHYLRRHVSPRSDLPIDLVQVELPAGSDVSMPASSYALARQLIWLQQGELVFVEGATRHEMRAGDCLELGPPNDCRFINESSTSC